MHPISSKRRPVSSLVFRAAMLTAAVGMFAACDQHSAQDAPENYGHGSSHERVVPDHKIDSNYHTNSFSDTAGTKDDQATERRDTPPAGSPTPTQAAHF